MEESNSKLKNLVGYYTSTVNFCRKHPYLTSAAACVIGYGLGRVGEWVDSWTPKNCVLEIDFTLMNVTSTEGSSPWESFVNELGDSQVMSVSEVVRAIEFAGKDKNIRGVIAKIGHPAHFNSFLEIQRVRKALDCFTKPKICFIDRLFGNGIVLYYLASVFDEIILQPKSSFMLEGLSINVPFLKNMLGKLSIEAHVNKKMEYKSAGDVVCEEKLTPEYKETLKRIMEQRVEFLKRGILAKRQEKFGSDEDVLSRAIDLCICSSEEALSLKLVDGLEYRDEVYERLWKDVAKVGEEKDMNLLYLKTYYKKKEKIIEKEMKKGGNVLVALIHAYGEIRNGRNLESSQNVLYGDDFADLLDALAEDKDLMAVVVKVDSPGGDVCGSEVMRRSIERARAKGKLVVIYMENVAASGGYWMSMSADLIVCEETCITGSIGVIGIFLNFLGLSEKLGITIDGMGFGKFSQTFNQLHSLSEEEQQLIDKFMQRIYDDFIELVGRGRKLSKETVEELAKGKVYVGKEALELNLVDKLGDMKTCLESVRELLRCDENDVLKVVNYPEKGKTLASIFKNLDKPKNSRERRERKLTARSVDLTLNQFSNLMRASPKALLGLKNLEGAISWVLSKIHLNVDGDGSGCPVKSITNKLDF